MKKYILLIIIFSFLPFLYLTSQNISPTWNRTLETNGLEVILRADSMDNLIVFAETYNPGSITGFMIAKFSPEGNSMWTRNYDTFGVEYIVDCISDKKGDVYVCGDSRDAFTGFARFVLLKYAHNGDSLWTFIHGGTQNITSNVRKLLLDKDDNLILIGNVQYPSINDAGLLALKISPDGEVVWEASLTEGEYGYGALDAKWVNDRYVIWGQTGSPEGQRFIAWEIDKDGNNIRHVRSDPYSETFSYVNSNYNIDEMGNFFVGDVCCEYKIIKFDNLTGQRSWTYQKTPTFMPLPTVPARLTCVNFDKANNVIASGSYYENDKTNLGILTSKLDQSGQLIWESYYYSQSNPSLLIREMTVNKYGITSAGSGGTNDGKNQSDILILHYDNDGKSVLTGLSEIDSTSNTARALVYTKAALYLGGTSTIQNPTSYRRTLLAKYPLPKLSSTQAHSDGNPLAIYPNPFQQGIIVAFNYDGRSTLADIRVSNNEGNLSWSGKILLQQGENKVELPLSALPPGTYYVTLQTDEARHTVRMVKN